MSSDTDKGKLEIPLPTAGWKAHRKRIRRRL